MIVYCNANQCTHNDDGACKLIEIELDIMGGCQQADLPDSAWFDFDDTEDDGK